MNNNEALKQYIILYYYPLNSYVFSGQYVGLRHFYFHTGTICLDTLRNFREHVGLGYEKTGTNLVPDRPLRDTTISGRPLPMNGLKQHFLVYPKQRPSSSCRTLSIHSHFCLRRTCCLPVIRMPAEWDSVRQCYTINGRTMWPGFKPATGTVRHKKVQCMCRHGGAQCTAMCPSLGLTLTASGALICARCHTCDVSGSFRCTCECAGCTTMQVDVCTAADAPAPSSLSQELDGSDQKVIPFDVLQQRALAENAAPPPAVMTRCVCRLSGIRCGSAALLRTQLCRDCRFTSPPTPAGRTYCACDCFGCTEGREDDDEAKSEKVEGDAGTTGSTGQADTFAREVLNACPNKCQSHRSSSTTAIHPADHGIEERESTKQLPEFTAEDREPKVTDDVTAMEWNTWSAGRTSTKALDAAASC